MKSVFLEGEGRRNKLHNSEEPMRLRKEKRKEEGKKKERNAHKKNRRGGGSSWVQFPAPGRLFISALQELKIYLSFTRLNKNNSRVKLFLGH